MYTQVLTYTHVHPCTPNVHSHTPMYTHVHLCTLMATLTVTIPVLFIYFALAVNVPVYPEQTVTRT